MKSEKLLELIGGIDDRLVHSAVHPDSLQRTAWLRLAAAAAAIVLTVCIGVIIAAGPAKKPGNPPVLSSVSGSSVIADTSETYQSLDQLLEHLSRHENHSDDSLKEGSAGNSRGVAPSGIICSTNAVIVNGYACHAGESGVVISSLDGNIVTPVHTIDSPGARLLSYGNYLIVACQKDVSSPENDFSYQLDTHVCIYDMTKPETPVSVYSSSQTGSFCGAFISGEMLWLLSSDGECACGYSRLEDKSRYIPEIIVNGSPTGLTDRQLHILGEPSMVRYLAVCGVKLDDMSLAESQVLYGDLESVHYGMGYLALEARTAQNKRITQPEVYVFGLSEKVGYSGRISTAAALDIPDSCRPAVAGAQSFELTSLTKSGSPYLLTGRLFTADADKGSSRIAFICVEDDLNRWSAGLSESISGVITITETLDEKERQIICYSTFEPDYSQRGHFAFASYVDGVRVTTPDMDIDHLDGIDMMYSYGSPYGHFNTLMPVEDGIYLRYGGTPDCLRAYDLSDPEQPRLINGNAVLLESMQRFCYSHHAYGDGRFGAVVLTPGLDEESEYNYRDRYLTCEYVVYKYEPSSGTLSPVSSIALNGYNELTVLEYSGTNYCFTASSAVPVPVN